MGFRVRGGCSQASPTRYGVRCEAKQRRPQEPDSLSDIKQQMDNKQNAR